MREFEGVLDVAAANLTNQQTKSKKKEPLLFAIGGRLSYYKKNVLKIKTTEPLRERPTTAPEPLEQPAISDSVRNGLDPNRPVPIIATKQSNERLGRVHKRVKHTICLASLLQIISPSFVLHNFVTKFHIFVAMVPRVSKNLQSE